MPDETSEITLTDQKEEMSLTYVILMSKKKSRGYENHQTNICRSIGKIDVRQVADVKFQHIRILTNMGYT